MCWPPHGVSQSATSKAPSIRFQPLHLQTECTKKSKTLHRWNLLLHLIKVGCSINRETKIFCKKKTEINFNWRERACVKKNQLRRKGCGLTPLFKNTPQPNCVMYVARTPATACVGWTHTEHALVVLPKKFNSGEKGVDWLHCSKTCTNHTSVTCMARTSYSMHVGWTHTEHALIVLPVCATCRGRIRSSDAKRAWMCNCVSIPSPVRTRKTGQVSWPLELHVVPYTTLLNSSMVRLPGDK